ncbi:hypothetical protein Afil01_02910 [Actinorhabdospora filicis]|uniref:Aminoglycoside phosphotransferase domain-containing protein n=1 Tax=Actinorhabdospora filicis TaxID=1785913 RepID=A0A9W6W6E5_9ACTN|nr:aminoglycoside phosphotransferase family protein [Actinorhabdospora filicis]GLZ75484.1 hypothetical protein Afil01_02910 [Actinorhabdospora filicis]
MELIGRGRDADVFALDERRVLRRYREGGDTEPEARLMTYLRSHGYPVPEVFEAAGPDMVMERVDGVTLTRAALRRVWNPGRPGKVLGELHNRLHAIPAPDWLPRLPEGGDRVVHLDLHPENVMVTAAGPVVIDWRNAMAGAPQADIAMVVVLFKAMTPPLPWAARKAVDVLKAPLLARFLITTREHELSEEHIASAVVAKLRDPNVGPGERVKLERILAAQ